MAKALVNIKLKRKDGAMVEDVWNDGSKHEALTRAFVTVLQGEDTSKPPFVAIPPDIRAALIKGGFKLDDYYVNAYVEKDKPAPKLGAKGVGRKTAPPAADMFGEDDEDAAE